MPLAASSDAAATAAAAPLDDAGFAALMPPVDDTEFAALMAPVNDTEFAALMAPVDDTEFAALMAPLGPFAGDRRVAVAVSGGADSLCLALLAARWGRPLALIVDHGLRPDSAAEARQTAARLARIGVPHRVLALGLPPGASQAAARHARHAALTAAAREAGLIDLLLGHHAADQRETRAIRALAQSGPAGLAGMARLRETGAVRLLRPLLPVEPARLRLTLAASGIGWIDDPSNRNPAFLRARLRLGPPSPPCPPGAGADRARRDATLAACLAARVSLRPEGIALLTPGPILSAALAALLRMLAGAPYPPRSAQVARLAADPRPATLAGIRLLPAGRLGPGLLLVREAAAMAAPIPAIPDALWDRRFRLSGTVPRGLTIGALGGDARFIGNAAGLPAAVLATLPALRDGGSVVAAPHLGYAAAPELRFLRVLFSPADPAAGAPFAA